MIMELTNPTWVENFRIFSEKYGSGLNMIGLTNTDIGIYIFLYTQKWFGEKSRFSSIEISNKLNGFSSILPEKFRTSFSSSSVSTSLQKLVYLGFIIACPNTKKESSGGRPANYLYETNKVTDTQQQAEQELKNHIKKIKDALFPFSAIEEGFTMKGQNPTSDGENRKK